MGVFGGEYVKNISDDLLSIKFAHQTSPVLLDCPAEKMPDRHVINARRNKVPRKIPDHGRSLTADRMRPLEKTCCVGRNSILIFVHAIATLARVGAYKSVAPVSEVA